MIPTLKEILDARTGAGGWTKATLKSWGVSWPPKKGWRVKLELASIRKFPKQDFPVERDRT